MKHPRTVPFILLLLFAMLGCGGREASPRRPLFGRVTIDQIPIAVGSITLIPTSGSGVAASTAIIDGEYRFTNESGPYGGYHNVVIGMETNEAEIARRQKSAETTMPSPTMGKATPLSEGNRVSEASGTDDSEPIKTQWELTFSVPSDGSLQKDFEL